MSDDLGQGPWLVFVYGTLKRDQGNNHHLARFDSELVGVFRTADDFALADGGFPQMVDRKPEALINGPVVGEVWKVTDIDCMRSMDRLEGHPRWYVRQERKVVSMDPGGQRLTAHMYIMPSARFNRGDDDAWIMPDEEGNLSWPQVKRRTRR